MSLKQKRKYLFLKLLLKCFSPFCNLEEVLLDWKYPAGGSVSLVGSVALLLAFTDASEPSAHLL